MRFLLLLLVPSVIVAGPVRDRHIVAELVPAMGAIIPGKTLTVCLNIKHDPEWHTYWKNPGIAGVPTKLDWDLPEGFSASPIQWARPQRVKMAIYNTNGYEGEVTLLVDIETPENLEPGTEVELKTRATWMMCAKTCYPSSAKLSLTIPVAKTAEPHRVGAKLAAATRATMPVENKQWKTTATLGEKSATLILTRRENAQDKSNPETLYFFSDDGLIDSHPEQTVTPVSAGVYKMVLPRSEFGPKDPRVLSGVLLSKSGGKAHALSIRAKLAPQSKP
jgi:DsbC/DsbD-like thiol-disulfide interchange protein